MKEKKIAGYDEKECVVTCLSTQPRGRPLLELDIHVQCSNSRLHVHYYIRALRQAGGVVNTAIVMAGAEGIISSRCPSKLQKQGGDIQIGKDWAKSLMSRMGFAGKILSLAILLQCNNIVFFMVLVVLLHVICYYYSIGNVERCLFHSK